MRVLRSVLGGVALLCGDGAGVEAATRVCCLWCVPAGLGALVVALLCTAAGGRVDS